MAKDAIATIGKIIAERIGRLAYENGEGVDYAIEQISKKCGLRIEIVDSVMRGLDYYIISHEDEIAYRIFASKMLDVLKVVAEYFNTSLDVLKVVAEYFNTSTDYLLGLTDRMY